MTDVLPNAPASLATAGHVYCAGTVTQCLYRYNRLPADKKANAFLKMGPDGMSPTIVKGEDLNALVVKILGPNRAAKTDRL